MVDGVDPHRPAIQVETPDPDNNRQPEAKPANPALHGGRSLKQRRTGFFGLVGPPKADTEEACFFLARRAVGVTPIQTKAASGCSAPAASDVSPQHADVATHRPQTPDGPSRGRLKFDQAARKGGPRTFVGLYR